MVSVDVEQYSAEVVSSSFEYVICPEVTRPDAVVDGTLKSKN